MLLRMTSNTSCAVCGVPRARKYWAVLVALSCWYVLIFVPHGMGQEPAPVAGPGVVVGSEDAERIDEAQVQAARQAMESDPGLDDAVKAALGGRYEQAMEALRQAGEYQTRREAYRQAALDGPGQVAALRTELAELEASQGKEAPERDLVDLSLDQLQEKVEMERTRVAELDASLREREQALSRVYERPVAISTRLAEITESLNRRQSRLLAPELMGEELSPGYAAERMLLRAELERLESEQAMLRAEQNSQAERESLIRAEVDLRETQLDVGRESLREVESALAGRARAEAARAAEVAGRTAPGDDAQLAIIAEEVQVLIAEYNKNIQTLAELNDLRSSDRQRAELLRQEFEIADAQIQFGAADEVLAPVLFEFLRRLREQRIPMETLYHATHLLDSSRLAALRVEEGLRTQRQLEAELSPDAGSPAAEILELRREWLTNLRGQYRTLIREAASFSSETREALAAMNAAKEHLSRQLFTVRSVPPIRLVTFTRLPETTAWFFGREHFSELGRAVANGFRIRPFSSAVVALLVVALLVGRPALVGKLKVCGSKIKRIRQDRFGHTSAAVFWTFLLAAPLPLALFYVHWTLTQAMEPSDWLWGIMRTLPSVAWSALGISLLLHACRREGLAAHFGWSEPAASALRRVLFLFAIVYLPAMLLIGGGLYGERTLAFESLTRVAYILAHLWVAGLAWRLFKIGGGGLGKTMADHPESWLAIKRPLWHTPLVLVPLALAVAAALGYLVTAINLSFQLLQVAGWIAGGSLLYWLILRWFMIRERRMALDAALDKRSRARLEAQAGMPGSGESAEEPVVEEEDAEALDLALIGEQTRQLLRSFFAIGVVVVIMLFLARAVPMLAVVDQWYIIGTFSLLDLLQLILIATLTIVGTVNLPGFLNLALLHPMNVSPGTRHAITTLAQYAAITIGFALGFHVLQIDWAKFGWIAAALSVGLGFGLQEVVSNFVSGLILLFERPIRVGDVVTVEGITGTVTKIRMRATTVTSHDQQEFLVPNKNFVTGTLLNWTLTSPLNRITIPVGVAYGSDTGEGLRLLREIAEEHPLVLSEPGPLTSFEGFDDSSLSLVLRVYLPDMSNRLKVITDLHQEIHRRFSEAGIEIAFPQRDLNLGAGWEKVFGSERGGFGTAKATPRSST